MRAKRSAGGQSGHEGAGRSLAPEDQVNEFVDHYPDSCRGCGHEFAEDGEGAVAASGSASGRGATADHGPGEGASQPSFALPVLQHARRPPSSRPLFAASPFGPRLQAAVLDADSAQPRSRAVTCRSSPGTCSAIEPVGRRGRRDLPARLNSPWQSRTKRWSRRFCRLAGGQRRRDRLDDRRERTARSGPRPRPEAAIFRIAADRHRDRLQELLGARLRRHLLLRPLVGLQPHRPRKPPSLLEPPPARLPLPLRRPPRPEAVRRAGPRAHQPPLRSLARLPTTRRPRPARTRDRPGHIAGAKVSDRRHPVELAVASFVPPAAAAVARVVSVETHGVERTGQRVRHGGGAGRVCVPATASKPSSSVLLRRRRSSRAGCYRRFPTSTAARAALGLAAEEIGWLWSLFGDPITSIRRADRSVFSDGAHRLHALRVAGVERVVVCTCDETDG